MPHVMCHVYSFAGWAEEVNLTQLKPPQTPQFSMTTFMAEPTDCTEDILVFFGISLVL